MLFILPALDVIRSRNGFLIDFVESPSGRNRLFFQAWILTAHEVQPELRCFFSGKSKRRSLDAAESDFFSASVFPVSKEEVPLISANSDVKVFLNQVNAFR